MGKAQSKRSVDITTEVKKDDVPEEGTGKMGKIEDVDQLKPQVNGDTHHNESDVGDKEKQADTDGTENEKDLSTEKEQQSTPVEPKANLEGGDDANNATTPTGDKPVVENGNGNDDTLNESKNAADTTTENGADSSSKKPKKEKVKKKWSLRSISFGKKDKQKPPKKEETAATNGDCEKVPEEASEEPTKTNGDATAEENAVAAAPAAAAATSTDEKSPAVSPANESKEVTIPAVADAIPAAESTPILNGTSEHAKDDKPIAEVAPTVVDEKIPEPIVEVVAAVAEPPKVDAVPEVVAAAVSESVPAPAAPEPVKQEAPPVPAKIIEVKAENIADETNENKLEAASSASEQPEQGDINKEENKNDDLDKNIGGDSESAQNLSPPPLPCTSPPSQVTVFALSDDGKGTPEIESLEIPAPIEAAPISDEPTVITKENTIVLGNPVDSPSNANLNTDLSEEKTKEINVEDKSSAPEIIALPVDIAEAVQVIEDEIIIKEVGKQESSVAAVDETTKTPAESNTQELQPEPQSAVNTEQIAETIALIDEVTQQAAIGVEVVTRSQSSEQNTESIADEQKPTTIESESDPSHPADQTPVVPEQQSTSEPSSHVEVDPSQPKEEETVAIIDNTGAAPQPNELIGDHGDIIQSDEINSSSIDAKDKPIINPTATEDSVVKADDLIDISPVDELKLPTVLPATIASEAEDASQGPKSKENGFGENHAAETSATESLNGQSEHKTIEEIKSDCAEKLLSDATTEQAAATIEVKE